MKRICLLPSVRDVNPLESRLFDEESGIARELLDAFGGTSASWTSNRARFSYWIYDFKEFEDTSVRRVAFLSLWTRKCVFNYDPIQFIKPFIFPIALKLSRGASLPLGTLCLGTLY